MALDFPASPNLGDTFVASNNVTYVWDGTKWGVLNAQPAAYLPLTGGRLSGALHLAADPILVDEAANKRYVDVMSSPAMRVYTGCF